MAKRFAVAIGQLYDNELKIIITEAETWHQAVSRVMSEPIEEIPEDIEQMKAAMFDAEILIDVVEIPDV